MPQRREPYKMPQRLRGAERVANEKRATALPGAMPGLPAVGDLGAEEEGRAGLRRPATGLGLFVMAEVLSVE